MQKMPSRFLQEEVRRQWLAQPPVRRRRAHVQSFGETLLQTGTQLGATPAVHFERVTMIVRSLVEPG